MDPEFWLERWHRNEIGFHQEEINVYLSSFWQDLHVPKGATVFVPLCGKSLDMAWLQTQGYHVVGVEVSRLAVESFFGEMQVTPHVTRRPPFLEYSHGTIRILCGDFFSLKQEHLRDVAAVFDRASLIALPSQLRDRYGLHLTGLLPPGVQVLLVTLEYPEGEMNGPPFPVGEVEIRGRFGGSFQVRQIVSRDILDDNPRFKTRGLTALTENVYLLDRTG